MNINYFLIEANRFKLNRFERVPLDFILELISYIYDGNAMVNLTKRFVNNSVVGDDGVKYFYFNLDTASNRKDKAYGIINTQRYLATISTNSKVRQIYVMSLTDPSYKELAFVLFLLGVVNTEDYLKFNVDINYVVSRFDIRVKRDARWYTEYRGIVISVQDYISLMGIYYKNAMEGARYNVNPLDFIWNAIDKFKNYGTGKLNSLLSSLRSVIGCVSSLPVVQDDIFLKYIQELAVVASFTKLTEEDKSRFINACLYRASETATSGVFEVFSQSCYIELNDSTAVNGVIEG